MPEDRSRPTRGRADIRIREAQRSDIDDLVALEAKAFASDRVSRRRFMAHAQSASAALLVARQDGVLVGYALVLTRRDSPAARLYSIAVDPRATGRGVGARLLAAAEAEAGRLGARYLRLEVRTDNATAIRLYEGNGYQTIGRREDYYEDGAPALRYQRHLPGTVRKRSPARPFRRAA